ncbi:hypothetical protein [Candidatus Phytoplasma oryzae]|nr:hypothetical protein PIE28_00440 [Candidatus Phytoplasma oryzae]
MKIKNISFIIILSITTLIIIFLLNPNKNIFSSNKKKIFKIDNFENTNTNNKKILNIMDKEKIYDPSIILNYKKIILDIISNNNKLENELKNMFNDEKVILNNKIIANNYINSEFFQNFKKELKKVNDIIKEKNITYEEEKKISEIIKKLDSLFKNNIKIQLLNLKRNLLKQKITKKELQEKINWITNEKNNEDNNENIDLNFQEYKLRNQYKRDNQIATIIEEKLEQYQIQIKKLKLEQKLLLNNINKFENILKKLNQKDIDFQKELDKKEKENLIWQQKDRFLKNPEHIKLKKDLKQMYIIRQEIIQSLAIAKTEEAKIKSDYNYYDDIIKKIEMSYNEEGQKFVQNFGKLKNSFKNLNSFKKEPKKDIQQIIIQLKEIYDF